MKIIIEERESGNRRTDKYAADMIELPGTPPLGFGATKEEAVAELFRSILYSEVYTKILVAMCQLKPEDGKLIIEYK